jgi:hypothetical protein
MPRKPLDAFEHGGRLVDVGAKQNEQENARLQALLMDSRACALRILNGRATGQPLPLPRKFGTKNSRHG